LKDNIDISITLNKIKILKEIGPYFPKDFHPILNKSIVITERIVKAYEVMEFVQMQDMEYVKKAIPVENNSQRLNHISSTIEEELQGSNIKDIGITMETILNMDRLRKIFTALLPILSDPGILDSPDGILKLANVLMDGRTEEERNRLKEMVNMLEMINKELPPK